MNLGQLLFHGQQGLERNVQSAYKYFSSALIDNENDANLEYNIGIMKLKGEGKFLLTYKNICTLTFTILNY
jgi:TPR repeat protein